MTIPEENSIGIEGAFRLANHLDEVAGWDRTGDERVARVEVDGLWYVVYRGPDGDDRAWRFVSEKEAKRFTRAGSWDPAAPPMSEARHELVERWNAAGRSTT